MSQAEALLRSLGCNAKYQGFRLLLRAVELVVEDESYLLMLTKRLYPDVAMHFHATATATERNLRTVINACWQYGDRQRLCQIAGRDVMDKPSAAQFIDMAAAYLRQD